MPIYPFYLGKQIAKPLIKLLLESEQPVAVLPGRFQPFHRGHYEAYKYLVNKFGMDRVYIATSDKTEPGRSPFNFAEKQQIISSMFDIDPAHIVQTRNPYVPAEITAQLPPGTPVIVGMGEKDAARMKGFSSAPGDITQLSGYDTAIYAMTVPMISGDEDVSGEQARQVFASGDEGAIHQLFQKMYGRDNPEIMSMISGKVAQSAHQATTVAAEKQRKASAPRAAQFYKDRIKNPDTDNELAVQSALAYPKDSGAYQAARNYLKSKGVLIEQLTDYDLQQLIAEIFSLDKNHLLLEGGAFGHLQHIYENLSLSFDDLKELVKRSLGTGLGQEGPISEKVDGQNIMMTFKNGEARFARNKGQLLNKGQASLSADGVRQFFAGHQNSNLESTFGNAATDLETAIQKLSHEEQEKMFGDGTKFMNVEILHPSTENVVPYGNNMLILHQIVEYNDAGEPVSMDSFGGDMLADVLRTQNAQKQKEYSIRGRQPLAIFSDTEGDKLQEQIEKYTRELDAMKKTYGLTDAHTLGDFKQRAWGEFLDNSRVPVTPEEREGLIRRWALKDKSFRLAKLSPEIQGWAGDIDTASSLTRLNKKFMFPIESFVGKLATDTIARSTELLASQNPLAAEQIKQKVDAAIKVIRASDDLDANEKLDHFLGIIDSVGLERLAPSEGIVFSYRGELYKYTGLFAPLNQIINAVRMAKPGTPLASTMAGQSKDAPNGAEPAPANAPMAQSAPATPPQATAPKQAPAADAEFPGIRPEVLNKTIRNPETGNQILVRSALKYPQEHPMYIAARRTVDSSQ